MSSSPIAYILDAFPAVRERHEAAYGTYRTKSRILAPYDECAALPRAVEHA